MSDILDSSISSPPPIYGCYPIRHKRATIPRQINSLPTDLRISLPQLAPQICGYSVSPAHPVDISVHNLLVTLLVTCPKVVEILWMDGGGWKSRETPKGVGTYPPLLSPLSSTDPSRIALCCFRARRRPRSITLSAFVWGFTWSLSPYRGRSLRDRNHLILSEIFFCSRVSRDP